MIYSELYYHVYYPVNKEMGIILLKTMFDTVIVYFYFFILFLFATQVTTKENTTDKLNEIYTKKK